MVRPVGKTCEEEGEMGEEKRAEERGGVCDRLFKGSPHMHIWAYRAMPRMHIDCLIMLHTNCVITQRTGYVRHKAPCLATEPHMSVTELGEWSGIPT